MVKTSVYLDDQQKHDLKRVVELTGRSQSDLIRDGVNQVIRSHLVKRPKMRAGFHDIRLVGRTEESMEGFGE